MPLLKKRKFKLVALRSPIVPYIYSHSISRSGFQSTRILIVYKCQVPQVSSGVPHHGATSWISHSVACSLAEWKCDHACERHREQPVEGKQVSNRIGILSTLHACVVKKSWSISCMESFSWNSYSDLAPPVRILQFLPAFKNPAFENWLALKKKPVFAISFCRILKN